VCVAIHLTRPLNSWWTFELSVLLTCMAVRRWWSRRQKVKLSDHHQWQCEAVPDSWYHCQAPASTLGRLSQHHLWPATYVSSYLTSQHTSAVTLPYLTAWRPIRQLLSKLLCKISSWNTILHASSWSCHVLTCVMFNYTWPWVNISTLSLCFMQDTFYGRRYVIGQAIIFLPCGFYLSFFLLLLSFFSSPNLSGRRLDVYHTSAPGVALVRI